MTTHDPNANIVEGAACFICQRALHKTSLNAVYQQHCLFVDELSCSRCTTQYETMFVGGVGFLWLACKSSDATHKLSNYFQYTLARYLQDDVVYSHENNPVRLFAFPEAHTGAPAPQEGDAPYNPYTDDAMFSEDERSALPREPSQRRTLYLAALMDVAAQEKVIPPFSLQGNVLQEREDFRALLASGLDPLPMPTRGWFVRQIVPQSVVELFVFDDTALNDLA